jgi:hypothetical protein
MLKEIKTIKVYQLRNNLGQVQGLPKNPRLIKDDKFAKLKKSIEDNPEMLKIKELVVFPFKDKGEHESQQIYLVIGGNMRLHALKELGVTDVVCKVLREDTSVEDLKKIVILDNASFGSYDYDSLANDWDNTLLEAMGMDLWHTLESFDELNYDSEKDDSSEPQEKQNRKIVLKVTPENHARITDFLLEQGDGESLEVGMMSVIELVNSL